jgi:DNA helicase-2/ATP-dependent DNA helicase PcrA
MDDETIYPNASQRGTLPWLTMTHVDLLAGLNEPQRQAVLHGTGPALILAGAGSGKTKALTHRIAHLMSQGVEPWQILAVTFTNKAAQEMKARIQTLLQLAGETENTLGQPGAGRLPMMGTFHSICVRILRRDIEHLGRDRSFVIYDGDDQERLMKQVLKDLKIDEQDLKPRAALSGISRAKSEGYAPLEVQKQANTFRLELIARCYKAYQEELRRANACDFDDLILETVRLFHEVPDVLQRYQRTWQFLHVDEYQDTNHAQYLLISQLAALNRNLCVIGDPDQSIYGFRGADIRNILEFRKEHPDAIEIRLEQNYRSSQPILSAADGVIAKNPNRPQKQMWTTRTEGPKVLIQELRDERSEAETAITAIRQLEREGVALSEQVILYRTHAQSRQFEEACLRAGIPYRLLGGVKFYGRREVKDVLAYLQAILNPRDTLSILRILNVPSRKLGAVTVEKLQAFAQQQGCGLWDALQRVALCATLDAGAQGRLQRFTSLLQRYQERSQQLVVSELAAQLIDELNLEAWLREDEEETAEERWQNVRELLSVMHKYDALEPLQSLQSFLEEAALVAETDKLQGDQSAGLTLMTVHLCKGLEYEHVVVVGCEEGIFPHSNSLMDQSQLEEERRLMYVAMTRAKTHLRLLLTRSRMLWGQQQSNAPSRFLEDLPADTCERRSDAVLSAFAWASEAALTRPSRTSQVSPYLQRDVHIEFNQDAGRSHDSDSQVTSLELGSRVRHPKFGDGAIVAKRGDVVEIRFDSGEKKTLALSIAPLQPL